MITCSKCGKVLSTDHTSLVVYPLFVVCPLCWPNGLPPPSTGAEIERMREEILKLRPGLSILSHHGHCPPLEPTEGKWQIAVYAAGNRTMYEADWFNGPTLLDAITQAHAAVWGKGGAK